MLISRCLALVVCSLLVAAAPAKRGKPAATPAPVVLADTVRVVLTTEAGAITVDLDHKRAPVTTANFVRYVDQKRFDGTTFYRSLRLTWGTPPNGLIQGGPKGEPKRVLKPIAHEPTTTTGILHKAGTISMARLEPGSATGDFFILMSDLASLDADPKATGDNVGYAAFGQVVSGMEVARAIFDAPLSATAGVGALKGQMLTQPVRIITARRVAMPVVPAP